MWSVKRQMENCDSISETKPNTSFINSTTLFTSFFSIWSLRLCSGSGLEPGWSSSASSATTARGKASRNKLSFSPAKALASTPLNSLSREESTRPPLCCSSQCCRLTWRVIAFTESSRIKLTCQLMSVKLWAKSTTTMSTQSTSKQSSTMYVFCHITDGLDPTFPQAANRPTRPLQTPSASSARIQLINIKKPGIKQQQPHQLRFHAKHPQLHNLHIHADATLFAKPSLKTRHFLGCQYLNEEQASDMWGCDANCMADCVCGERERVWDCWDESGKLLESDCCYCGWSGRSGWDLFETGWAEKRAASDQGCQTSH